MEEQAHIEELRSLHLAATRRDWNGCHSATEQLLLRLLPLRALTLARDFVASRLPIIERHYPDVRWPREFIEAVCEPGTPYEKKQWPQDDEFSGPGANNLISAVHALWTARQHIDDQRPWTTELATAIAGAIMAESTEHWGSRHPEEWARWYSLPPDSDDMSGFEILMAATKDPDAMRLERAAWLEVADKLEAALRQG